MSPQSFWLLFQCFLLIMAPKCKMPGCSLSNVTLGQTLGVGGSVAAVAGSFIILKSQR